MPVCDACHMQFIHTFLCTPHMHCSLVTSVYECVIITSDDLLTPVYSKVITHRGEPGYEATYTDMALIINLNHNHWWYMYPGISACSYRSTRFLEEMYMYNVHVWPNQNMSYHIWWQ